MYSSLVFRWTTFWLHYVILHEKKSRKDYISSPIKYVVLLCFFFLFGKIYFKFFRYIMFINSNLIPNSSLCLLVVLFCSDMIDILHQIYDLQFYSQLYRKFQVYDLFSFLYNYQTMKIAYPLISQLPIKQPIVVLFLNNLMMICQLCKRISNIRDNGQQLIVDFKLNGREHVNNLESSLKFEIILQSWHRGVNVRPNP